MGRKYDHYKQYVMCVYHIDMSLSINSVPTM